MKFLRRKSVWLLMVIVLSLAIVPVALAWPFGDVPVGYWAYDQIHRFSNLNITSGCGGGNFCPENYVTRAQMAVFMTNLTTAWTTTNEPYLFNIDHKYTGAANYPALIASSYSGNGVQASSYGGANALHGVLGQTNNSTNGGYGVYGVATTSDGVVGYATSTSGTNTGVWGYANGATGRGVYGVASHATGANMGVFGYTNSTNGFGVVGQQAGAPNSIGTFIEPGGWFSGGNGVVGMTNLSGGVGIVGNGQNANSWAGYFYSSGHGVGISTPAGKTGLTVIGGTKNAQVQTDDGDRLLYTEEATEVWFADYGFGQLQDGAAVISIDPTFAQTVNLEEPYHVFVQVYGDAEVYVSNRTATQFEVHLRDGDANVEFSYRIVAKRLGYEDDRLEPAPWPDSAPNLAAEAETRLPGQREGAAQPMELDTSRPVPVEQQPKAGE